MSSSSDPQSKSDANSSKTEILGLVGVGLMGTAIAQRLISAGYAVLGWDTDEQRRQGLIQLGGNLASNTADLFDRCDRVLLSLPNDAIVSEVLRQVKANLRPTHILLDTSTGDPVGTCKQESWLREYGVEYLDATISGSSVQLLAGTAVMLVGASPDGMQQSFPILSALADKVFHVGPVGRGAQMKLVTNLVLGLNRAALAEGLAYADSLGLPLDQTLELLRGSMSYSRIMDTKGEKMIGRDYAVQAKLSQHAKDVGLILEDASRAELRLPLTEVHAKLLRSAIELGLGDCDNSAIFDVYRKPGDAI